jgi:hypothetical protein
VDSQPSNGISPEELAAESVIPLPDEGDISLLDLNSNLDLALDTAAPIDFTIPANDGATATDDPSFDTSPTSTGDDPTGTTP